MVDELKKMVVWASIDWTDIQNLCIEHGWYTKGTNADFKKLQEEVWKWLRLNLAVDDRVYSALSDFAWDIKFHSSTYDSVGEIAQALMARVWWRLEPAE